MKLKIWKKITKISDLVFSWIINLFLYSSRAIFLILTFSVFFGVPSLNSYRKSIERSIKKNLPRETELEFTFVEEKRATVEQIENWMLNLIEEYLKTKNLQSEPINLLRSAKMPEVINLKDDYFKKKILLNIRKNLNECNVDLLTLENHYYQVRKEKDLSLREHLAKFKLLFFTYLEIIIEFLSQSLRFPNLLTNFLVKALLLKLIFLTFRFRNVIPIDLVEPEDLKEENNFGIFAYFFKNFFNLISLGVENYIVYNYYLFFDRDCSWANGSICSSYDWWFYVLIFVFSNAIIISINKVITEKSFKKTWKEAFFGIWNIFLSTIISYLMLSLILFKLLPFFRLSEMNVGYFWSNYANVTFPLLFELIWNLL